MGRKLIKRHTAGEHEARVHRDSEYNAYRVTFYHKGKKAKGRTEPHYETDDEDDAHGTAQAELKKLHGTNEAMERLFTLIIEEIKNNSKKKPTKKNAAQAKEDDSNWDRMTDVHPSIKREIIKRLRQQAKGKE